MAVLYAALVNWLVTTIIVDSELVRPLRDWLQGRALARVIRSVPTPAPDAPSGVVHLNVPESKLAYLLSCHLCTGTWVGIAEAVYLGSVIGHGVLGIVFTGLLFKAVGHCVLVVISRLER